MTAARDAENTMNRALLLNTGRLHRDRFGSAPQVTAYAPGRVEVLGNHTDYNEGYVLSAAIDCGVCFAAARATNATCRVVRADTGQENTFDAAAPERSEQAPWTNYIRGVAAGLSERHPLDAGFSAVVAADLPIGAGLSSSAALEVSCALALCELYGITLGTLELARLCQEAEHEYAGMKCGLLDQISSLCGEEDGLILTDFRSLEVQTVRLGSDACFLVCDTKAKHSLVDSEYNERRASCEQAAAFFAERLPHPVSALRDVSSAEWDALAPELDPVAARRAAHVIGENERVCAGRCLLQEGNWAAFGALMFESHESSRENFENSCPELDVVVETARELPAVVGARLSGGGFGGSAILLVRAQQAEAVGKQIRERYETRCGHPCDVLEIHPAAGARLVADGAANR